MIEPIDTEMHVLNAGKEQLILSGNVPTRFAALDVARAEYEMEKAADRLYERYWRDSKCPVGSTTDECCAISRREVERNLVEFTPFVRDYEEQMRVFFREAYGLSTAIASNRRRLGLRRPQRPARGLHLQERSCLRALHQGHILFQLFQRNLLHAVGPCHVDQRDGHVQQPLADQHVDVQAPVAKIRRPHADGCLQIGQCLGTAQLVQTQQLGHAVQRLGMGRLLLQHLFIGLASLLELPLFMQLAGLLQMLVRIHLGHQGCGQAPHHRLGPKPTPAQIPPSCRQAGRHGPRISGRKPHFFHLCQTDRSPAATKQEARHVAVCHHPRLRTDTIASRSIGTGPAFTYSSNLPAQEGSAKIHRSVCPHRQVRSSFSGTYPMPSIDQFIESFLTAVDFQEAVAVTPDTELRSLPEWDSLAALGVIVMFDVDYGKTITGDDLKNCSTITDLYKLLG